MSTTISWVTSEETVSAIGEAEIFDTLHVLEFDAVTKEDADASAEVTRHPVELRAEVSDHKIPAPRTLKLEGHVTQTPLGAPPRSGFASSDVSAAPEAGTSGTVITYSGEFDRVRDVAATLERLRSEAIDVSVETRIEDYENMQVENVSRSRSEPLDAVAFQVDLVEVLRASTERVAAPLPREPRGNAARRSSSEPRSEDVGNADGDNTSWLWDLVT